MPRFVYSWRKDAPGAVKDVFPNIRVLISPITAKAVKEETYTRYTARVCVFRSVRPETLSSLFQYPASRSTSCSTSEHHPILGVSRITLESDGALVAGNRARGDGSIGNLAKEFALDFQLSRSSEKVEETLRQLGRFIPVSPPQEERGYDEYYGCTCPVFEISVDGDIGLDACLREVSANPQSPGSLCAYIMPNGCLTAPESRSTTTSAPCRDFRQRRRDHTAESGMVTRKMLTRSSGVQLDLARNGSRVEKSASNRYRI